MHLFVMVIHMFQIYNNICRVTPIQKEELYLQKKIQKKVARDVVSLAFLSTNYQHFNVLNKTYTLTMVQIVVSLQVLHKTCENFLKVVPR